MKRFVLAWLGWLAAASAPSAHAVEILRWERLPLAVPLHVGQERIVFIDKNVRVGVPANMGGRLRVQSAGGAVYLLAKEPIESTRLQLQDMDTGALILLDIATTPADEGSDLLEPVRIVEGDGAPQRYGQHQTGNDQRTATTPAPPRETPIPVVLTRFAAQNLYAPLRTVEPLHGVMRVNMHTDLRLDTLLPTLPVRARALAAWRLEDMWVTAVRLTNTGARSVTLDPRLLQGDLLAATFQHETLGPRGIPEDTTVLYVVTRGHGLAQSLLPAIHRFDPAVDLSQADVDDDEEVDHAQ